MGRLFRTGAFFHEGDDDHDHFHDDEDAADGANGVADLTWVLDNVELTTVGVDVGSSTSHLMFSRIYLRRLGEFLSSRYVVINRETLYRSPILLTPYRNDNTIDASVLDDFIQTAYCRIWFDAVGHR